LFVISWSVLYYWTKANFFNIHNFIMCNSKWTKCIASYPLKILAVFIKCWELYLSTVSKINPKIFIFYRSLLKYVNSERSVQRR
jgi:hypothetical protein